jgi:hypothetical protein
MLTVRSEQLSAFRHAAARRFESSLVKALQPLFPLMTRKLGELALRDIVRHGITRAREYGIVRQRDVGRYLAVMMMFGPDFDLRPSSGWLYTILRDPRLSNSAARTDALCREASKALRDRTHRTGRKPTW